VLKASISPLAQHSAGYASLLQALAEYVRPIQLVILRGSAEALPMWQQRFAAHYAPHRMVLAIATGTQNLTPPLAKPESDVVNAWICEGVTCLAPIADLGEALRVCKAGQVA
jgi:uncharacterized protein